MRKMIAIALLLSATSASAREECLADAHKRSGAPRRMHTVIPSETRAGATEANADTEKVRRASQQTATFVVDTKGRCDTLERIVRSGRR